MRYKSDFRRLRAGFNGFWAPMLCVALVALSQLCACIEPPTEDTFVGPPVPTAADRESQRNQQARERNLRRQLERINADRAALAVDSEVYARVVSTARSYCTTDARVLEEFPLGELKEPIVSDGGTLFLEVACEGKGVKLWTRELVPTSWSVVNGYANQHDWRDRFVFYDADEDRITERVDDYAEKTRRGRYHLEHGAGFDADELTHWHQDPEGWYACGIRSQQLFAVLIGVIDAQYASTQVGYTN